MDSALALHHSSAICAPAPVLKPFLREMLLESVYFRIVSAMSHHDSTRPSGDLRGEQRHTERRRWRGLPYHWKAAGGTPSAHRPRISVFEDRRAGRKRRAEAAAKTPPQGLQLGGRAPNGQHPESPNPRTRRSSSTPSAQLRLQIETLSWPRPTGAHPLLRASSDPCRCGS